MTLKELLQQAVTDLQAAKAMPTATVEQANAKMEAIAQASQNLFMMLQSMTAP